MRAHRSTCRMTSVALTLEIVLRTIFGDDYAGLVDKGNPFAMLTAENERDLKFAYTFRQLSHLLQGVLEQRRSAAPSAPQHPANARRGP